MAERFVPDDVARQHARNQQLVAKISELGGDLREQRTIDFFFYASDEGSASELAADLGGLGFVNVHTAPRTDNWVVTAEKLGSVEQITEERFVQQLVSLAARHLAEFDGWGTAV